MGQDQNPAQHGQTLATPRTHAGGSSDPLLPRSAARGEAPRPRSPSSQQPRATRLPYPARSAASSASSSAPSCSPPGRRRSPLARARPPAGTPAPARLGLLPASRRARRPPSSLSFASRARCSSSSPGRRLLHSGGSSASWFPPRRRCSWDGEQNRPLASNRRGRPTPPRPRPPDLLRLRPPAAAAAPERLLPPLALSASSPSPSLLRPLTHCRCSRNCPQGDAVPRCTYLSLPWLRGMSIVTLCACVAAFVRA